MIDKSQETWTFYVIRHAQTEFNRDGIVQGYTNDAPLTEEGLRQAEILKNKLAEISFDAIFSSDSLRAVRTAELVRGNRNIPINHTLDLREKKYGSFEGTSAQKYREALAEATERAEPLSDLEYWHFKYKPDVESHAEANTRLLKVLHEIVASHAAGKTILVVTHGGLIRTLLLSTGHSNQTSSGKGIIHHTGYLKVKFDGKEFIIEEVNEMS